MDEDESYEVSEIAQYLYNFLENDAFLHYIRVRGEVTNVRRYSSGHCYFSLKDSESTLPCVLFRWNASALDFDLQNGMKISALGSVSIYGRDTKVQLLVESAIDLGTGGFATQASELKKRLQAEGLFDEARKKSLPEFPEAIGIVTSANGAVLHDICRITRRRWQGIRLILAPVHVQGFNAKNEIAAAIRLLQNVPNRPDVLIVGRGGGSSEDLQAFNEEVVVRAIANSKIPIVSAVGHQTDYTLADLAADIRAATPSQAAELAVPDAQELLRHIDEVRIRLQTYAQQIFTDKQQKLSTLSQQLTHTMQNGLNKRKDNIERMIRRFDLLSPTHVLGRGYAMLENEQGIPIARVRKLKTGDAYYLRMQDGRAKVRVESLE